MDDHFTERYAPYGPLHQEAVAAGAATDEVTRDTPIGTKVRWYSNETTGTIVHRLGLTPPNQVRVIWDGTNKTGNCLMVQLRLADPQTTSFKVTYGRQPIDYEANEQSEPTDLVELEVQDVPTYAHAAWRAALIVIGEVPDQYIHDLVLIDVIRLS
jgi:hypothetical protein